MHLVFGFSVLTFLTFCHATKPNFCREYSILEKKAHCGPYGYLIAYGKKYCKRFQEPVHCNAFDAAGKEFIMCTTKCLVDKIKEIVTPVKSCDIIEKDAFDSHVDCYLNCQFCKICKTNKAALFGTYDIKDFFSMKALKQVYAVMKKCGPLACF